jgi:RNA polymerase sigma-70 factor (ECF subfamily)
VSESHQDKDEDLALVERILEAPDGDTRAFEDLVQRHSKKVVANCRYITRSSIDAEDLAQDVFVKAYFAIGKFQRRSKFRTWLQRIKVNHCLNYLKKTEGRSFQEIDDAAAANPGALSTEPRVWRSIQAAHERERIERALEELTDTLRIPLILRDMDEMSYQEIADLLGVGLSAVKMRIKRARQEFRQRYQSTPREEAAEV